ncbi:MAG: hypothetical protein AAB908_01240 [Patescibacteria group bacterium]
MVKYIIVALIAFTLVALAVIWVLSGGPRKVFENTQALADRATLEEGEVAFQLPWQPAQIFPTLDITDALDLSDGSETGKTEARLVEFEAEYDRLSAEVQTTRSFGNPSPYIGKISIVQDVAGVRANTAGEEYLQIAANYSNPEAIDISGWTLESALSGVHIMVPPAASPFIANSANVLGPTSLAPGGLALVSSAPSPVGVSFRENMCTGYLGQFQRFSPRLFEECPSPSAVLPFTESNLVVYGETCFERIANVPECRFPQNLASVSSACRAFLTEKLSYNGCVSANSFRSGFNTNTWRMYLGASGELWRNSHDAIRLLDAEGRTVSVFVY